MPRINLTGGTMRKLELAVLAPVTAANLSFAASKLSAEKNGKDKTFTGVIMDSQSAMMGSHEKMEN
jgi:hypothetical protein